MISELAATASLAAPFLPLAGMVALRASRLIAWRSSPRRIAVWSTSLSLVCAIVSLMGEPVGVRLGNWLAVPGTGFRIALALQYDELSRVWLVVTAAAGVGAAAAIVAAVPGKARTAERLLLACAFSELCAVSGGLLQFLACSLLAVVCLCSALGWSSGRSLVRAGVIGNLFVLICAMALWSVGVEPSFATLSNLDAVLESAASADALSIMRAVMGFAATCLVGAFLVKCGQFPLGHWLIAGTRRSRAFAAGALLTVLPHGVLLLLRGLPLLSNAPEALLSLGGIACLSMLLGGMMALTAEGLPQATAMFASGACSLAALAIAQAGPSGAVAAAYVSASAVTLSAMLLPLAGDALRATTTLGVAVLVGFLTCGVWGQDAVLRLLWSGTQAGPLPLFPILALLAHGLLSAGIFLEIGPPRSVGRPVVMGAVIVMAVLPVLVIARPDRSSLPGVLTLVRPGMCGLAMLIALVGAYLTRRAGHPEAGERQPSGLMELSRRRFYVREFVLYGWETPLRVCSRAAAFAESVWCTVFTRWSGELGLFESRGRDRSPAREAGPSTALLALFLVTVTVLMILIVE